MSYVFRLMSSRLAFRVSRPFAAIALGIACALSASAATTVTSWSDLRARLQAGESVRLGADCTVTDGNECQFGSDCANKQLFLDLNGYVLTHAGSQRLFVFTSGSQNLELTLRDSSATGRGAVRHTGGKNKDHGQLAYIAAGGKVVVENGTYTGFRSGWHGAAFAVFGTLELKGGSFSDCQTDIQGGCLCVFSGGSCTVSGNVRISSCSTGTDGGAAYVESNGTLTVAGGVMTGCKANGKTEALYVCSGGSSTVSGCVTDDSALGSKATLGTLKSGYALTKAGSVYVVGSGVSVESGAIAAGTFAFDPSEAVYAAAGLELAPHHVSRSNGDGTYSVAAPVSVSNWTTLRDNLLAGRSVKLGADITQDGEAVSLDADQVVALDLNGHTLTRHDGYRIFRLNSAECELTLDDTSASGAGLITCTGKLGDKGGLVLVDKGHLVLVGGTFTGKATGQGGFAYVDSNGRVTMNGGTVSTSTADGDGGAFYVYGGTVTMNGGTISSCQSSYHGGAMRLYKGGTVTVNGGRFSACKSGWDGATFYADDSDVTLNGGVFENCGFYRMTGGCFLVKGGVYDKSRSSSTWWNGVTFENSEYSFTGSDSATHYLVGSNASFTDGNLAAGTFTFDPSDAIYASGGLRLYENRAVKPNGDGTFTIVLPVTSWSQLKENLHAGVSVRLDADVTQDSEECYLSGTQVVTLDLNGHTITGKSGSRVFALNSSDCQFTIDDSSASGKGRIAGTDSLSLNGGVVKVESGHLILSGGTFTGRTTEYGGFAYIRNVGRLTMNGGVLSDCRADSGGGGICNDGGTLTVNAGMFSGCQSTGSDGGAIYVFSGSTTIRGGTFSGNYAKNYGGAIGASQPVNIYGGYFTGNTAGKGMPFFDGDNQNKRGNLYGCVVEGYDPAASDPQCGACDCNLMDGARSVKVGSLYVVGRDVTVSDTKLAAGTFTFDPSGADYVAGGLQLATCGVSSPNGDGTYSVIPRFESVTSWSQLKEKLLAGACVRLDADIAQDSDTVYFEDDQIVTIDLNGHTLTSRKNYRFIDLNSTGCEVTLDDTSASGTGKVTCTDKLDVEGGLIRVQKGHLVLENGTFTGKSSNNGGFASVKSEGRVTMNGGAITGCEAGYGGAFYLHYGTVTMNGGTISACMSSYDGGAFRVKNGSVTLNGGRITDCSSKYGGVAGVTEGSVTVNGGTFRGCTAKSYGGTFDVYTSSSLTINGGVFEKTASSGFCVSAASGKIRVKGGVFDCSRSDTDKWSGTSSITFENPEYAFTGSDSATHYLVGRDAAFTCGKLSAGTYTFDPREADYGAAGLSLPSYATVTPNGDATYTVAVANPVVAETWEVVRESLSDGLDVTLAADVEASGTMCNLKANCAGRNFVLDLNGHVITHTATADRFLTLFPEAANCVLTIRDSSEAKTGAIVHAGEKMTTNGGCLFIDGQKVILESGTISGFASSREGAGVITYRGGVFEMKGGAILDCKTDSSGAAVHVLDAESSFAFVGGVISNCTKSASAGSAVANHGTTHLAGGLVDDATITNASNNVTFETGCSFVGIGTGLYVIGRNPTFSNGRLVGGTFFFDPSDPLYAASGLALADFVSSVGLRDGTWRLVRGIERGSIVKNGGFERGTALPPEGEAGSVATSGVLPWTGGDGATVFSTGWAATNGLTVLTGEYAVRLAPGACVTQEVVVLEKASYFLSTGYRGAPGATLAVFADGNLRNELSVAADGWRCGQWPLAELAPGVHTLVLSNASVAADGVLAIDDVAMGIDADDGIFDNPAIVNNGDFEVGTTLPAEDGEVALADAGLVAWTSTGGVSIYGVAATNGYPCGVYSGMYAAALDEHAEVSQTVQCLPGEGTLVVNGVTGRWYAVSFSYAAQTAGREPVVRVWSYPSEAGAPTNVFAYATAAADGSWSSTATLTFLPVGTNVVAFVNDSNSGRVVLDAVSCKQYVHPLGDLLVNGSFEYGAGLPSVNGSEYVTPVGRAEPAAWTVVSNTAVVFGRRARRMTLAGVLLGSYAVGLKNATRLEQTFLVPSSGTYRVGCVIAERFKSSGANHPTLTISVDGESLGTFTATRYSSYDAAIAFCDLEPGSHVLSFEAVAGGEQMLMMDVASIRLKRDLEPSQDVTGVTPEIRIAPSATTVALLAKGAELTTSEIDPDMFEPEDFSSTPRNDYFRLEGHAGAYAHPEYRPLTDVEFLDGCTISLGGRPRTGEGPILTCRLSPVAQRDQASVLAIESSRSGRNFSFVAYPLTDGLIGAGTELFTVPVTNLVEDGVAVHFAAVWLNGQFSFYANGRICGTVAFAPGSPFVFESVRLGAFPEGTDPAAIADRRCGTFDLSDVRVYTEGLTDSQVASLAADVRAETVQVTLYDASQGKTFGTFPRAVGACYGPLASANATRSGYGLVGWTLSPEPGAAFVSPDTLVTETADHRLYAKWTNNVYTVTYDFNGYPFAENRSQTIYAGETYDFPSGFEVDGVAFHGWTNANGTVVASGAVFPAGGRYEDETLYADYDNGFGTLVFEPHNGEAATVVETVLIGSSVRAAAPADPVRPGYTFFGWFDAEAGGNRLTDETPFAHIGGETWHAQWQGDEQTVTWRAPAGCRADVQMTVSRSGEAYGLPETIPAYTNDLEDARLFYGWGREVGTNGLEVIAVWDWETEDWRVNDGVVTWTNAHDAVALWWTACPFDANGGLVAEEKTWLYPSERYDAWMPFPSPAREGYVFDGWRTNVAEGAQVTGDMIVTDPLPSVLVAAWTPVSVRVSLDPNDGSTNGFPCVMVQYERPYGEFPTPTRPGYALASWHYVLEDGFEITPETIVSTYQDHTAVASWTNAWFTMTYQINGVVGKSFSQRYENPWQDLYVPTQAQLGEHGVFKGWTLAETGELVAEGEPAKMTRDGFLVALVAGESCTLTLDAVDGILDVDRRTIELEYGRAVSGLPEPPDVWRPDCTFLGWYTQDGLTQVTNGMVWGVSGTTPLHAKWRGTVAHTVTYERNMTLSASIAASHELCYGDAMPTVAKPKRSDGAKFLGWYYGEMPCTDTEGNPLPGYVTCPWEVDVMLKARWSMPRDAFAKPGSLEDGVTNTVIGVQATDEPNEPNHDSEGALRATHWYDFEGTAGTTVRIAFEDLTGKEPCVQLVIYAGTDLTGLVEKASVLELDAAEAVLEWTPDKDGVYRLALAQGRELDGDAGLSSYRISATGVATPTWKSAWTDPGTMPGATDGVRVYNALVNDGFSSEVATRLSSPTNAYTAFRTWAHAGVEGEEVSPEDLCDVPGVILTSAYGLTPGAPVPADAALSITDCLLTTNLTGDASMRLWLAVSGDFAKSGAQNTTLLEAAVGVKGASSVSGPYTTENFDVKVEQSDAENNLVRILATPKEAEPAFFFRGVTY